MVTVPAESPQSGIAGFVTHRTLLVIGVMVVAVQGQTPAARPHGPVIQESAPSRQSPQLPASSPASGDLLLGNRDSTRLARVPEHSLASHPLFDFKDSDIKFKLERLMNILRDSRHESWVLSAYPDPTTSRPLIGAGFSLDVAATPHPQHDPVNPNSFLEPSSAQLWQEAGLDPDLLQNILEQFYRDLNAWQEKGFRKNISAHRLLPELTEEDATKLLRISVIQAIHNAKAYCGRFDQLTGSQQMALTQLVYQMGINLEEFVHFLTAINDAAPPLNSTHGSRMEEEKQYWRAVQRTLIQSDWAMRYTIRAVAVIAMFDPNYDKDPARAEHQVRTQIRPLHVRHRKKLEVASIRSARPGAPRTMHR